MQVEPTLGLSIYVSFHGDFYESRNLFQLVGKIGGELIKSVATLSGSFCRCNL